MPYKIDPGAIHEWKRTISSYFTEAIVRGNEATIQLFLEQLREEHKGLNDRDLKKAARELNARTSQQSKAISYTIVGLSVRAGLHSEEELIQAIKMRKLEKLEDRATRDYDNSLDSYIKMYLAYQKHVSNGRTPEKNALFDLEFFIHLDAHDTPFVFVTTELLWLELGRKALPSRVIPLTELLEN